MKTKDNDQALLTWLFLAGFVVFFIYVLWETRLLTDLLGADRTKISTIIFTLFSAASVHCAWKSWVLSRQQSLLFSLENHHQQSLVSALAAIPQKSTDSPVTRYLRGMRSTDNPLPEDQLAEVLSYEVRKQHQSGWFITGVLVKLGLLGTVIGFILMLASVGELKSVDTSDLQFLIKQMTAGMGIALITTIFGLISSMLLGMQYLLLDSSADQIVARAINIAGGENQ